ncbi:hypothetical protein EYF80_029405 [Liparis tanakae]|uniref:Uncharacterized protein n=1 Tax=Liparis tanakae TaxID=230148 RepID=A0A4Z2H3M6_9TELE|nr:hypothetical protein EYF80_029405 [Liparis tanakae]
MRQQQDVSQGNNSRISVPFSLVVVNSSSVLVFNSAVSHSIFFSCSSFSCSMRVSRCYDQHREKNR